MVFKVTYYGYFDASLRSPIIIRYMYLWAASLLWVAHSNVTVEDCVGVNADHLLHPVSSDIVQSHCERIVGLLDSTPWAKEIAQTDSLVLNDVVPFTVATEPPFIDTNRRRLLTEYVDYAVSGCHDVVCVALALNEKVWLVREPTIVFEAAAANQLNSYSVNETWDRGNGSCTAMSVFLITALRLAGVPARLVGTPHWNLGPAICPDGDASAACGNHNWVEVYVPTKGWSFIDQRRPDQQILPLNESWFSPDWLMGLDGSMNHSVFAVSFIQASIVERDDSYPKGTGVEVADHFPMAWDWNNHVLPAWDVSFAYRTFQDELSGLSVIETS